MVRNTKQWAIFEYLKIFLRSNLKNLFASLAHSGRAELDKSCKL